MPSIIYASPLILTTFMEGRNYHTYFTYEDTDAGKSWCLRFFKNHRIESGSTYNIKP